MEWQDATTYSKNDKEKTPTAWRLKLPSISIYITHAHIYYKGEYIMHCKELGFDTFALNMKVDVPLEEVKKAAIYRCKARINSISMQLNSIS